MFRGAFSITLAVILLRSGPSLLSQAAVLSLEQLDNLDVRFIKQPRSEVFTPSLARKLFPGMVKEMQADTKALGNPTSLGLLSLFNRSVWRRRRWHVPDAG